METTPDQHVPSWDEIVERHSDRVYRLAYRLTGNRHDAEDLTQEVFVRVFRSLSTYTPGHLRGLAAPHHHQPLPRPGPPQAADPLRRPLRRAGRAAHVAPRRRRTWRTSTAPSTTTSSARSPPCRRTSGRRSCCATSRASPTRRSPRSSAPSSAPSAPASTAVARCCAPLCPPGARRRPGAVRRARRRAAHLRPGDGPVMGPVGHLGTRVSALLDGQLSPEETERAWAHVHTCHALPRPRRA